MIRHIVLFKLKDFSSEEERNDALDKVLINFRSLVGEIPQIRNYKVEKNIQAKPGSYEIIIDSDFDCPEDLIAYQNHPAHKYAVEQNEQWCRERIIADYQTTNH